MLFGLLQRWRQRRREKARQIFKYWDGAKDRAADPISIARAIDTHPTLDLDKHVKLAMAGDNESHQIIVTAVREVFGVSQWTESTPGLTERECFDLLDSFAEYIEGLKKNSNPFPTDAPPMESPAPED